MTDAAAGLPSNPMDKLASEYDRWYDSPEGRQLFEVELACVREVMGTAKGRWLEVGVGTGRFAAALGIRDGVDPSASAIELAKSRGIDASQGTAESLPFSDGSFDGVLFATTLCFVANAALAMQQSRRVLRRGGQLVIAIIPANSSWGQCYAEKGREGHPFYSAAHFFTCREVVSLAENVGFEFRRASSCLFNPPSAVPTTRTQTGVLEEAGFVCLGFSAS